jgi:ribosomal protein L37AE/L43A
MQTESAVIDDGEPVAGRTEAALVLNDIVSEEIEATLEKRKQTLRRCIAGVAALIGFGVVLLVLQRFLVGGGLIAVAIIGGLVAVQYVRTIDPDVEVTGVEKRYWTTHLFPEEDGTIVYDATGTVEDSHLEFYQLENEQILDHAQRYLQMQQSKPIVMNSEDNVEAQLRQMLAAVQSEIENPQRIDFSAPLIKRDTDLSRSLAELGTYASTSETDSVGVDIESTDAESDIETIESLGQAAAVGETKNKLETIKQGAGARVEDFQTTQEQAIEILNDHVESVGDVLALNTYNFYCPVCDEDGIDSKLDYSSGEWFCATCQQTFDEHVIIPKHRMKDHLVSDIWTQLWVEVEDERRAIYENIEDRKSDLEEREFEQRRMEIKEAANRIKDLRSDIRDLRTEAKAGIGRIEETGDLMVKYERLDDDRQKQFQNDIKEAIEEVDQKTRRILEETEGIEQKQLVKSKEKTKERREPERPDQQRVHREETAIKENGFEELVPASNGDNGSSQINPLSIVTAYRDGKEHETKSNGEGSS